MDITAFVLVFPPTDEDDKYEVLPYFWIPEETLVIRVKRDHMLYNVWEKQGSKKTTEGKAVHYSYIEKFIENLVKNIRSEELHLTVGCCSDGTKLRGNGFYRCSIKEMSPPTKELMKLKLEQKIAMVEIRCLDG